jgi:hypothetical protein
METDSRVKARIAGRDAPPSPGNEFLFTFGSLENDHRRFSRIIAIGFVNHGLSFGFTERFRSEGFQGLPARQGRVRFLQGRHHQIPANKRECSGVVQVHDLDTLRPLVRGRTAGGSQFKAAERASWRY